MLKINIEVYCSECGAVLSGEGLRVAAIVVTPCQNCLDKAKSKGFDNGFYKRLGDGEPE